MKKLFSIILVACLLVTVMPITVFAQSERVIDMVEIVGATLDIKAGDKPSFTAKSAKPDLYYIEHEEWDEISTGRFIASTPWYNNFASSEDQLIDKFVAGKKYVYQIAIKAIDPEYNNSFACEFSKDTKLSINGKIYTVDSENVQLTDFSGVAYVISFYGVTTVQPKSSAISSSSLKASLSKTSYVYDGKVKKPNVVVKNASGKVIPASNYTVSYASGRKNVGKYSVKITFKGNYSGTKTLYFTINPTATSINSVVASSKGFTVKWKKQATQTTGYEIQYSTDKNFKKNNKSVTVSKNSTTSKKISKLSPKKKYYVRIRTYKATNGTKLYSNWSKAKTVTTKK